MTTPRTKSFTDSEEDFHEQARRRTDLDDFGDDSYRTGLGILLESLDRDADLSPLGDTIFRDQITSALATRLRVEQRLARLDADQATAESSSGIERPIVITGLVRTGSTALHYLMGQDPDLQSLEYWLAAEPRPRPPRREWDSDADFHRAEDELALFFEFTPSLMAVHEMHADWPEECRHLLALNFTDDRYEAAATLPTYTDWYHDTPHPASYSYHRRLIELIGSTDRERRWLLKYPVHLRQLPALLAEYPDACIVWTHRDPCQVIRSMTSFIARVRALHENSVDLAALGREITESWAGAADAGMAARDARDDGQFFDLNFPDFRAHPIDSVQRIYDRFDQHLSPEGRRSMEAWGTDHPKGKHGDHDYEGADIGITDDEIRDRFTQYSERFGF